MGQRASLIERRSARNVLDMQEVKNPIRLGIVGLGHRAVGNVLKSAIAYDDYSLVSVCDVRGELTGKVVKDIEDNHGLNVSGYTDYSLMLENEQLDAVAVQVDPDKQVPLACMAMEAGCHVMMEVPAAYSMEHCWELVVCVERTGKIFLLMEQLRYAGYIQAWREIVRSGIIGKPLFAEGEYFSNKPDAFFQDERGIFYRADEAESSKNARPAWRNYLPTIGYLPHELSPILHVLDDRVERVTALSTAPKSYRYNNVNRADLQAALMHTAKDAILRMAVSHTMPAVKRGELGSHWHHIKGTEGALEWGRTGMEKCKLWVERWQLEEPIEVPWSTRRTDGPPEAVQSGHGGVDYFTFALFADAVLRGCSLEFDVYRAVESAAPAIAAAESISRDGAPVDVPDFRPDENRQAGRMP